MNTASRRHQWFSLGGIIGAVCLNALSWALILWKLPATDQTYFLHYTIYFGIDLVGTWRDILWIPGSGTAMFLMNIAFFFLQKSNPLFQLIILSMNIIVQLMILFASFLVVLLNSGV